MSRAPSVLPTDRTQSQTVFDRLREMRDQGEIDLVEDGGLVVTSSHAASFARRMQALSDQVSQLERRLAQQSLDGNTDVTALIADLNVTRIELTRIYNIFLGDKD